MSTTLSAGTSTAGATLTSNTDGILQLQSGTTPTTAVTIDASQHVGIGTTSPGSTLHIAATSGTTVYVQGTSNNIYGGINTDGTSSGTTYFGTFNNFPAAFGTTNAERMRIDTSGNLLVGTTSTLYGGNRLSSAGNQYHLVTKPNSDGYNPGIWLNAAGTPVGSIYCSSTATAYGTSSDPRLKNVSGPVTAANATAFVQALKPVTGTWKADGSAFTGFLTTDYGTVDPQAVVGTANATQPIGDVTDATGKVLQTGVPQPQNLPTGETWTQTGTADVYQQMEYGSSAWCANMTAALQSALTTIASMEAKLKAAGVAGF